MGNARTTSKEAWTEQSKAPSIKVPENKLLDQYEGKSYEDIVGEGEEKSEKKEGRNRAENKTGGKTSTLSGTFVEPSPHVTSP